MANNKLVDLLRLSEFKKKIVNLIPTKVSQLENDVPFLKTNKNAKILFGVSGLDNATMKIEDVFSAMPSPSTLYYSTTNEQDPIFTNNETLADIIEKHGCCGTFSIVKNEQNRSYIEWTVGLSGGEKPYRAIIGISGTGTVDTSNVIWVDDSIHPLTTSLAVTEEGVSALDGTVGKVLDDKGSQIAFYQDDDGTWHFRDWSGADTVIPFSGIGSLKLRVTQKWRHYFTSFGYAVSYTIDQTLSYIIEYDGTKCTVSSVSTNPNKFTLIDQALGHWPSQIATYDSISLISTTVNILTT